MFNRSKARELELQASQVAVQGGSESESESDAPPRRTAAARKRGKHTRTHTKRNRQNLESRVDACAEPEENTFSLDRPVRLEVVHRVCHRGTYLPAWSAVPGEAVVGKSGTQNGVYVTWPFLTRCVVLKGFKVVKAAPTSEHVVLLQKDRQFYALAAIPNVPHRMRVGDAVRCHSVQVPPGWLLGDTVLRWLQPDSVYHGIAGRVVVQDTQGGPRYYHFGEDGAARLTRQGDMPTLPRATLTPEVRMARGRSHQQRVVTTTTSVTIEAPPGAHIRDNAFFLHRAVTLYGGVYLVTLVSPADHTARAVDVMVAPVAESSPGLVKRVHDMRLIRAAIDMDRQRARQSVKFKKQKTVKKVGSG